MNASEKEKRRPSTKECSSSVPTIDRILFLPSPLHRRLRRIRLRTRRGNASRAWYRAPRPSYPRSPKEAGLKEDSYCSARPKCNPTPCCAAVPILSAPFGKGRDLGLFFNRSMRITEAYRDGLQYVCEEFKNRVYKAHHRIEDKSKW